MRSSNPAPRTRTSPFLAIAAIAAMISLASCGGDAPTAPQPALPEANLSPADIKELVYGSVSALDAKGFERMGPPQEGEWLHRFPETPQTFDQYRFATRVRPDKKRGTIVLQPLGAFDENEKKLLADLKEYAEVFFQLPTRIAEPIDIDEAAGDLKLTRQLPLGRRHGKYAFQYDADKLLSDVLKKKLPDDACVYLGITMKDIWSGDLNFVFGLGSISERVGVYSLCRYFPEFWGNKRKEGDDVIALRRSCKVLNHEAGHMFGLHHCVFYYCSMNGANSLQETDRAPTHFCPVCERKLIWNIAFDSTKRYEALRDYYAKHGMKEESEWMVERIKNWKQILLTEKIKRATDE